MHGFKLIIVVICEAVKPIVSKRSRNNNPNCWSTGNVKSCKYEQKSCIKLIKHVTESEVLIADTNWHAGCILQGHIEWNVFCTNNDNINKNQKR